MSKWKSKKPVGTAHSVITDHQSHFEILGVGQTIAPVRLSGVVLYRKSTLAVLLALIFVSFFGTLAVSAWMFPQKYDWRYRVISNLLSPRDNPDHYQVAAAGVGLTALLMLPFAGYLQTQLSRATPRIAAFAGGGFMAGSIALICASLIVPQHVHDVFGFRRVHEFLGRSAAGFLAAGMLFSCWSAWKDRTKGSVTTGLFWVWFAVTLVPLTGVFLSECLLLLTRLEPAAAGPIRSALRHSVFWHLGFWEWTGAAAVFVFLSAAVFLMPSQAKTATWRTRLPIPPRARGSEYTDQ